MTTAFIIGALFIFGAITAVVINMSKIEDSVWTSLNSDVDMSIDYYSMNMVPGGMIM